MARRGFDDSSPVHATIPRAKMGTERLSHHGVHGVPGCSNVFRACGVGLGQQQLNGGIPEKSCLHRSGDLPKNDWKQVDTRKSDILQHLVSSVSQVPKVSHKRRPY